MSPQTKMRQEILEVPAAVDRLLREGGKDIAKAAKAVRDLDPAFGITVARGSSDHVCTFFKYAAEIMAGLPVASVGPSIASLYKAPLKLSGSICIGVSQSGKSPDIVEMTRSAGASGAMTIGISNNTNSDLARVSQHTLDIHAGPELSVAATKTFVTSATAALLLLANWTDDRALLEALRDLPGRLEEAAGLDWPEVREAIGVHSSLFTLGRGQVLAISNEAALKFKETCQLHAESYSSAEVLHGPVSIVGEGFPILCFAVEDAAEQALAATADEVAAMGAKVFATSRLVSKANTLTSVRTGHPLTDALSLIVSFYCMVEAFATSRNIDPDAPRHLNKVTETV